MIYACSFVNWYDLKPGDQATWILAALTLGYFIVTIFLWTTARKTLDESVKLFDVLNAPWIDVTEIGYNYEHEGAVYKGFRRVLSVSYMNFGNVPAIILDSKIEFRVTGILIADTEQNPLETPLIPKHQKATSPSHLNDDELRKMLEPRATLTLDIEIHYRGASDETKTYELHTTYNNTKDRFLDNKKNQKLQPYSE